MAPCEEICRAFLEVLRSSVVYQTHYYALQQRFIWGPGWTMKRGLTREEKKKDWKAALAQDRRADQKTSPRTREEKKIEKRRQQEEVERLNEALPLLVEEERTTSPSKDEMRKQYRMRPSKSKENLDGGQKKKAGSAKKWDSLVGDEDYD